MGKKEYEAMDLYDFIETESSITCSSCRKTDSVMYADSGEEFFFEEGWRATRENVYCPKCAKKKLKNL
jgi:hypothetical protein